MYRLLCLDRWRRNDTTRQCLFAHGWAPCSSIDCALEISELFARDKANLLQRRELLLRFRGLAKRQKKLGQMSARTTVARVEHQRPLIVPHRRTGPRKPGMREADVVLDIRIERVA